MALLVQQRCANHAQREAAARCPGCRHFFCRECITEHDGLALCVACLAAKARVPLARRFHFKGLIRAVQLALAFALLWGFFYVCGRTLLAIPSSFHEGMFLAHDDPREE